MPVIPIRANNAYFGFAKQSVQGTFVAPTVFPHWLDGSMVEVVIKEQGIREGDGTRRLSQIIKNQQYVQVKLVCYPRPVELGFFEAAALGASSDALTPAVYTSTVPLAHIVGDTSLVVASATGLPSPPTQIIYSPGVNTPGTDVEEVVAVTSAAGTTLTVAPLKQPHAAGATVRSVTTHTITDQTDGAYFSCEVGIGSLSGGAGPTLRITDAKVNTIKRSSSAGKLLELQIEFVGIATLQVGSPSTVTVETRNPFYYSTGVWTVDGSTTVDALYVESFSLDQKNNMDLDIQSERITLDAVIFGMIDAAVQYTVIFAGPQHIFLTYFGSTTGTTDSYLTGTGSLAVTFTQVDSFHTVTYTMTTVQYLKAGVPQPKADGKHMKLTVDGQATSNQGANLNIVQTKLLNAQTTAY